MTFPSVIHKIISEFVREKEKRKRNKAKQCDGTGSTIYMLSKKQYIICNGKAIEYMQWKSDTIYVMESNTIYAMQYI